MGGLGIVELRRPGAANALDLRMANELRAALNDAATYGLDCLLLRANGRNFSAGGDMRKLAASPNRARALRELIKAVAESVRLLAESEMVVVCAVRGTVAGAGLGLALASDLVVAGESSRFLSAFSSIGFSPDSGVSWLLPQIVGIRRALEFTLTNRVLSAREAADWGLVTRVVDDDEVEETALQLAHTIATGPACALSATRSLVRSSGRVSLAAHMEAELQKIIPLVESPEAAKRLAQFLDHGT
jgi:2-(1,2-epoxy-1,2-dihydrophenyl)acetyl-CoA isomerase